VAYAGAGGAGRGKWWKKKAEDVVGEQEEE